jgi:hypothetical protein
MVLIPRNFVKMRINDIKTGKNRRMTIVKVQVKVMLRPSASLSSSPIWGPRPDFCYCQTLAGLIMWMRSIWQEDGCVVCNWWLVLANAVILWSESRGTHDQILLSQIRVFTNLEGQAPVFISPRNKVARLYTGTGFPFRRLLRLPGLRWRYSNPPPRSLSWLVEVMNDLYIFFYVFDVYETD